MIPAGGFDTDKYLTKQLEKLNSRVSKFERLYLEFGGKLFSDNHATRVLPGYRPDAKIELLKKMPSPDLFYCVSAKDIEQGRIRGDTGLTYDLQTVKEIQDIQKYEIKVSGIIITLFSGQKSAELFINKLNNLGYPVYIHHVIEGYPEKLDLVIRGYEQQQYVKPEKRLVVITGAGGGSGKMAFCLSQIFHETKLNLKPGYAKFETFPFWDLPVDHPINLAYEASTANIGDINQIDPYHKKEYGLDATNYNRDIENFAILKELLSKITGEDNPFGYKSPTDMGINLASSGIVDEQICKNASLEEIIRRYFRYSVGKIEGRDTVATIQRMEVIMKRARLIPEARKVVNPARESQMEALTSGKGFNGVYSGTALELQNGVIVTGKNSPTLHSESAAVLNALKILAGIPDEIHLISPSILDEISQMKGQMLDHKSPSLSVNETLIVLASCAASNPTAAAALSKIKDLRYCEAHSTLIPTPGDALGFRYLGINSTSEPRVASIDL